MTAFSSSRSAASIKARTGQFPGKARTTNICSDERLPPQAFPAAKPRLETGLNEWRRQ